MEAEFLSDLLDVCFNCLENSNGKGKVEDENWRIKYNKSRDVKVIRSWQQGILGNTKRIGRA